MLSKSKITFHVSVIFTFFVVVIFVYFRFGKLAYKMMYYNEYVFPENVQYYNVISLSGNVLSKHFVLILLCCLCVGTCIYKRSVYCTYF